MRKVETVLIEVKTGKTFLVKDLNEDFHTGSEVIDKKNLQKEGKFVSKQGTEYLALKPQFSDLWNCLQRGPQVVIQKDIGLILAKTGINGGFRAVDAGGGSGSLGLSLANVCKEITVYENNPEHYLILARNARDFGFANIQLKQEDITRGIGEKEVDLITLDLPEPWKVITHAEQALKLGGHLVVYLPNLHQVKKFIDSVKGTTIKISEIIELLERKWKIDDKIMRPEFEMLGHTGFLVRGRKM